MVGLDLLDISFRIEREFGIKVSSDDFDEITFKSRLIRALEYGVASLM